MKQPTQKTLKHILITYLPHYMDLKSCGGRIPDSAKYGKSDRIYIIIE